MPGPQNIQKQVTRETLQQQLDKSIRVATNMNEFQTNQNMELYNLQQTKEDIAEIDQLLTGSLQITDEQRARLEAAQGRNIAHLLVNQEKTTGDSKEMKAVKASIARVEAVLNREREQPMKVNDIEYLEGLYQKAINDCQYYCDNKNPTFSKGKKRKAQVKANLDRMIKESEQLAVAKILLGNGTLDGQVASARDLLVQAKVYDFAADYKKKEAGVQAGDGNDAPIPEPTQEEIKALGQDGGILYAILSDKMSPSDMAAKLSKDKKTKKLAQSIPKLTQEIQKSLTYFSDGKAGATMVKIGKSFLMLSKNEAGNLTLSLGDKKVTLTKNSGLISNRIDTDIVSNIKLYGEKAARDIVDPLLSGDAQGQSVVRMRQILLRYLEQKTGKTESLFAGFSTADIKDIVRYVNHGNDLKRVEKFMERMRYSSDVNSQEQRELLKQTEAQKEDMAGKVEIKKKAQEKKNDGSEWDEKETAVKNLAADLIFSSDTWTTDDTQEMAGVRMQKMLLKNVDALSYLVADLYSAGEKKQSLINGMLDKMPLFMMEKDQVAELRKNLNEQLTKITGMIDKAIEEQIKEKVGEGEGILHDIKLKGARLAAKAALVTPKLVAPMIRDYIEGMDEDGLAELAEAEQSIDSGVASMSFELQDIVKEYSGEIFKAPVEEEEKPMPNPDEPGLSAEEKKIRTKAKAEWGKNKLTKIAEKSIKGGSSGVGKFNKLVFENYFASVSTMDQRAMLASALRGSKPMSKLPDPEEAGISEEEKKARKKAVEKSKIDMMANYLSGVLKGAGPLFQKMLQGLPLQGMPEELQGALADMKSKLAPIPDEIVQAQLYDMVQRSNGKVTKIEVTRPLGAASVGQTFLCRLYGKGLPAEGREVAIKLLKPDVRNRMMREREVMLKCAKEVDAGTYETYKGQLARIEEELDLTIEARNVELGRVYNKSTEKGKETDGVGSMDLNTLIEPTMNSMVLEKAPGTTIDSLMEDIQEERLRLLDPYIKKDNKGKPLMKEDEEGKMRLQLGNFALDENVDPMEIATTLATRVKELQKKRDMACKFAEKWTKEAIFDEGYYHGDPHAGNIMISDEKLTVIDFGNATKLTEDQQLHVTRMMAAAAVGDMKTFRSGFHALLKPEFENLYQQKREEFGRIISEIFSYGDKTAAGPRIMVALLKAQELGLEVPGSIFNLSQGQMRLQNTIDDMNNEIDQLEGDLKYIHSNMGGGSGKLRVKDLMCNQLLQETAENVDIKEIYPKFLQAEMEFSDDPKEIDYVLEQGNFGYFSEHYLKHYKDMDQNFTSFMDSIDTLVEAAEQLKDQGALKMGVDQFLAGDGQKVRPLIPVGVWDELLECTGNLMKNSAEVKKHLKTAFDAAKQQSAGILDQFAAYETEYQRLKTKYKDTGKPTPEEESRLKERKDAFFKVYMPLHNQTVFQRGDFGNLCRNFLYETQNKTVVKEREAMFADAEHKGPELKAAYEEYQKAKAANAGDQEQKLGTLLNLFREITLNDVRTFMKPYQGLGAEAPTFVGVMGDVIQTQLKKTVGRLGLIKGYRYQKKLEE